jgi:hypothetical protein
MTSANATQQAPLTASSEKSHAVDIGVEVGGLDEPTFVRRGMMGGQ